MSPIKIQPQQVVVGRIKRSGSDIQVLSVPRYALEPTHNCPRHLKIVDPATPGRYRSRNRYHGEDSS